MSGGLSTTTNPWTSSSGNDTLSMLKEHGYNAVETSSGKYSVDLGNGQKVEFEKWEPLWTVLNRIESAKAEAKADSDNVMKDWYEYYEKAYQETTAELKETKNRDSFFKRMWLKTQKLFNSCLAKNEAKKVEDIQDATQREIAENYQADESNYYAAHRKESNRVYSLAMKGFDEALSAGKFSYC